MHLGGGRDSASESPFLLTQVTRGVDVRRAQLHQDAGVAPGRVVRLAGGDDVRCVRIAMHRHVRAISRCLVAVQLRTYWVRDARLLLPLVQKPSARANFRRVLNVLIDVHLMRISDLVEG